MTDVVIDEKILRQISVDVKKDEDIEELKNQMRMVMVKREAIGLAAIQLGVAKRVICAKLHVFDPRTNTDFESIEFFVNPVIIKKENPVVFSGEMCLSEPGKVICTRRYNNIEITFDGIPGEPVKLDGIAAQIIQHEIDHLDGKLMQDAEYKALNVGRNDPCICGSGKKYKKCCGK